MTTIVGAAMMSVGEYEVCIAYIDGSLLSWRWTYDSEEGSDMFKRDADVRTA